MATNATTIICLLKFHLLFLPKYTSILTSFIIGLLMKLSSYTTRRMPQCLCGSFYINLFMDKTSDVTFPRKQFPSKTSVPFTWRQDRALCEDGHLFCWNIFSKHTCATGKDNFHVRILSTLTWRVNLYWGLQRSWYSHSLWTGWSKNRIPVRGKIFRTRPDRPWCQPSLLYNGYWAIPGGKVVEAWRWPPTPV